jgi:serine/threonine-protein kinase RsbW
VKTPGRIQAGSRDTVELRIPARPENLALARLALAGVGSAAGAGEAVIADLKVAVTEACTNAIQHAYSAGAGSVVIRYRLAGDAVELEVEDDGTGFDPSDPAADADEHDGGQGMGLMIIRELADEVLVESDASGSRIAFARRLGSG